MRTTMRMGFLLATLGGMAASSPGRADAAMTLQVTGRVVYIEPGSATIPVSLGTTYTGTISYDERAPFFSAGPTGSALYSPVKASFDLVFDAPFRISRDSQDPGYLESLGRASLTNTALPGFSQDSFTLAVTNALRLIPGGGNESGVDLVALYLVNQSTSPSDALTSTSLADFYPDLSKFASNTNLIRIGSYADPFTLIYNLNVSVETLQVTSSAVPEPSSLALCGIPLMAGLVALARRRRA